MPRDCKHGFAGNCSPRVSRTNNSVARCWFFVLIASPLLVGQQMQPTTSGGRIAHLDGIDIVFDSAGQWLKVYSTYVHPVEFPDRRGIKKAQVIAEEKGKAAIVRFLQQQVQSDRIVEETESVLGITKSSKVSGNTDQTTKTAERKMVESVREFTRSYASGNIKGLSVIEVGYDEKKEEAWVKVGFSRTTMGIADQLRSDMQRDHTPGSKSGDTSNRNAINPQPSEVRSRKLP